MFSDGLLTVGICLDPVLPAAIGVTTSQSIGRRVWNALFSACSFHGGHPAATGASGINAPGKRNVVVLLKLACLGSFLGHEAALGVNFSVKDLKDLQHGSKPMSLHCQFLTHCVYGLTFWRIKNDHTVGTHRWCSRIVWRCPSNQVGLTSLQTYVKDKKRRHGPVGKLLITWLYHI